MLYSWPVHFTLFLPIPLFIHPCPTSLHIPSLICMVLPSTPIRIPQVLTFLTFLPSYQLQSPGVRSQSHVWSFLMPHQLQTRDFWYLALFPLSLVYQLCVCYCLWLAPLLIISCYIEKIFDKINIMKNTLSPSTYPYTSYPLRAVFVNQDQFHPK